MEDNKTGFFDKPKNIRVMLAFFFITLIGLVVIDFLYIEQHPKFVWDGAHGFFAAFGFAACVMVITISKILRFFLKREENYYE
ncbi:MAG: hypothetical protein GY714_16930 [Desulfobacterales bacterium]|nr:hypothetical protein [Desulfobacterales bacterium]MCP4162373.1 hypothetical protein [Deltaproteobacteria bacterium]